MIQGFKRLKLRDILKYMFIETGNSKAATKQQFLHFSILCLTRDFIRQGHAREKRKVYRATRTRSQAIDRG